MNTITNNLYNTLPKSNPLYKWIDWDNGDIIDNWWIFYIDKCNQWCKNISSKALEECKKIMAKDYNSKYLYDITN